MVVKELTKADKASVEASSGNFLYKMILNFDFYLLDNDIETLEKMI
jgi:hypothetical protein